MAGKVPSGVTARCLDGRKRATDIARKLTQELGGTFQEPKWLTQSEIININSSSVPTEALSSSSKPSTSDGYTEKVFIPVDEDPDINFLGLLIGPRGSTQKRLESESGARILFRGKGSSKDGRDQYPSEPLHVLIRAENDSSLRKAVSLVKDIIYNKEERSNLKSKQLRTLGTRDTGLRLNDSLYSSSVGGTASGLFGGGTVIVKVPRDRVGHIIGRGGETISMIQSVSGAFVQVTREDDPREDTKDVTVEGTQEQIDVARKEIDRLLEEFDNRRRGPFVPDGHELFTLDIPNEAVGVIIGRQGSTIRNLQQRTGANIQVARDDEAGSNSEMRAITIIGVPADVTYARQEIEHLVKSHMDDLMPVGSDERKIKIPGESVGIVIGRGGDTIKNIQARSGARVKIEQEDGTDGQRLITIRGDSRAVQAAAEEITQVVNDHFGGSFGPSAAEDNSAIYGVTGVDPEQLEALNKYYAEYYAQMAAGGATHVQPHQ